MDFSYSFLARSALWSADTLDVAGSHTYHALNLCRAKSIIDNDMNLSRYLTEELVRLEMTSEIEPLTEGASKEKWLLKAKETILGELVDLLDSGHRIGNRTKLLLDFVNREKQWTTAIGHGVAVPHIRSLQAKEFMLAFARSTNGYDFGAPDGAPVNLFLVMASPPYDDNFYLKAFKAIAEMLQHEAFRAELMTAKAPGEVIRALRAME